MMFYNRIFCIVCILGIFFGACATQPQSNPDGRSSGGASAEADAAAQDAARRLDDALSGRSSGTGTSGSGTQNAATPTVQGTSGGPEPRWVLDPYTAYSRNTYMAAVGYASNRAEADSKAFAALTAIFGQSIQSDFVAATIYSEAVRNGIITVSENTSISDRIVTGTSLDKLVGAQIGSVWDDGRGTVYALAYLDKQEAIAIYTDMINMNQANINRLTSMSAAEKNTFDGYARYKLAAVIADINAKYASVVMQCGGPSASAMNMSNAEALNIEASNILRNISVEVQVTGDRSNRVRDAFAGVLQTEGLRTRGTNPPYILEVTINMTEDIRPGNPYIFARYTVSADFVDRATDTVVLPFNFTNRAGHTTFELAINQAFLEIEREINGRYPPLFREYLAALMPQR